MPGRGRGGGFGGGGSFSSRMVPILEPPPLFPEAEVEKSSLSLSEERVKAIHCYSNLIDDFGKYRDFMQQSAREKKSSKERKELALLRAQFGFDSATLPDELKPKSHVKKIEVDIDEQMEKVALEDEDDKKEDEEDEIGGSRRPKVTRKLDSDDDDDNEEDKAPASTDDDDDARSKEEEDDDYLQSYFDPGENFLDEEDDNLDDGDMY